MRRHIEKKSHYLISKEQIAIIRSYQMYKFLIDWLRKRAYHIFTMESFQENNHIAGKWRMKC